MKTKRPKLKMKRLTYWNVMWRIRGKEHCVTAFNQDIAEYHAKASVVAGADVIVITKCVLEQLA
jgi:hypothetical protein